MRFWHPFSLLGQARDRVGPTRHDRMIVATLDSMTPPRCLFVERALALAQELGTTSGSAPADQIIDPRVSRRLPGEGREPLRRALRQASLGLDGFTTRQATRQASLTSGQQAFAAADRMLPARRGRALGGEAIVLACRGRAGRIVEPHDTPAAATAFAEAGGDVEFQPDATAVNTTGGCRDIGPGISARPEPGEKAAAAMNRARSIRLRLPVTFASRQPASGSKARNSPATQSRT